ncbi:hypothetical protein EDB81DRAFT_792252 [Dactylonectria macrodidyma]|uniref:Uncharacterized protein n=1 Tax=Dactylonectria macrodidyma TaxID=307937 RepID=A0A9P9EXN1_9HYPO|nr:hypothetical protein EDB81DRAFT_792252 [Dactylonectria macrodidyma]
MNWTEGALARHSRRKGWDKDAARQKQYFAKARARKHEATTRRSPCASSFIPDYIPHGPHAQDQQQPSPSSTRQKQIISRKRSLVSVRDGYRDMPASIGSESTSSGLREARLDAVHQQGEPSSKQGNSDIDIELKRRKLLGKNDWTGINFQKPIVVDYSRQGVGVCRATSQVCDSRPTKRQKTSEWPQKDGNTRKGNQRRDEAGQEINIMIGDQQLRWSRAGNSVRSPKSHLGPLPTFQSWASQQEESNIWDMHDRSSSSARFRQLALSDVENISGTDSLGPEFQKLNTSSADEGNRLSRRDMERKRERRPDQPQYIVASSPPIIHQPQPTRGTRLSLFNIRSPDPGDNGSMVVQMGTRDNESHRITADDSCWNDWLNNNDSIGAPDAHEDIRTRSITPGISHYWDGSEDLSVTTSECTTSNGGNLATEDVVALPPLTCSPTPMFPPDSIDSATKDPGQYQSAPPRKHSPDLNETDGETSCISVESFDCEESEGPAKVDHDLVLPSKTELPKAPNVQDLLDLLVEDEQGQLEETSNLEITSEDEEEVWKRFILDEDCAEISRKAGLEAHRQTTHDLCIAMAHPTSDVVEPPSASRESPSQTSYQGRGSAIALAMSSPNIGSGVEDQPSFNAASTNTTDTGNSTAARAGSPKSHHSDIRFHQPSLFIGRLASLPSASNAANVGPVQSQPPLRRRGRRRKSRGEGRPDFRAMPDYEGDPIEECCEGQ